AGLIYAHSSHTLFGRTRLQKEVKLLQRCGMPTGYLFESYFYGPYSDGVKTDVGLLQHLGLVREENAGGYFVFHAADHAAFPGIEKYQDKIDILGAADTTVLEVAATYDAYREMGFDHAGAEEYTLLKKGDKWQQHKIEALHLLRDLGLPHNGA